MIPSDLSAPAAGALAGVSDEAAVDCLRLHLATLYHAGLGIRLSSLFGGAGAALRQPVARLREVEGVSPALLSRLAASEIGRMAEGEFRTARREGIRILLWGTSAYPLELQSLPDMPLLLFARGAVGAEAPAWGGDAGTGAGGPPGVAIVGSRRPTPYGLNQARRFANGAARWGIAVVSGLARGIDAEAHDAALDAGGSTVAVLGSGLGRIYPREHRLLAQRIAEGGRGAVLTEFPFETAPRSFHFPMRNRLLSGLAKAVLVVEAGEKSGSLITVEHALAQGKSVFVVPGRVDRPEALGCLRLLREGAAPAIEPEDIVLALLGSAALGSGRSDGAPEAGGRRAGAGGPLPAGPSALSGRMGRDLELLFREEDIWHPDDLAERLGLSVPEMIRELSRLELAGALRRLPGGAFAKT